MVFFFFFFFFFGFTANVTAISTHLYKKVSKNLRIVWTQVTLTKSSLSAIRTFGPLGVNRSSVQRRSFQLTMMSDHVYQTNG
jgi:hypothetical protein